MEVSFLFARDEQGRILFVPWQPWSSRAYVIPDDAAVARLRTAMSRHFRWSLEFTALFVPIHFFLGLSSWALLVLLGGLLIAFALQVRRLASSFEEIRYRVAYGQRLREEASRAQRSRLRISLVASTAGLLVGGLLMYREASAIPLLVVIASAFGVMWSAGLLWRRSERA